jgi:phosphoribosylformylglycinamidine synthase
LAERSLQQAVLAMIRSGTLRSAHDCADGGLACTLAESAMGSGEDALGVDVALDDDVPPVAALFGEAQGRVVVSCDPERAEEVLAVAADHDVPARRIGTVGAAGGDVRIRVRGASVDVPIGRAVDVWLGALPGIMDAPPTVEA